MKVKEQKTFFRDLTFHFNRRQLGFNIPAADLDFLEYDHRQPRALIELKGGGSWRIGEGWSNIEAVSNLCKPREKELPFYVVEHTEDWARVSVCKIMGVENKLPIIEDEKAGSLRNYVAFLYGIRKRGVPTQIEVPERLEPITRQKIILELWDELSVNEKEELFAELGCHL